MQSKNRISWCPDHAEVALIYNGKEAFKAIIDHDDVDRVREVRWYPVCERKRKVGVYVKGTVNGKTTSLHSYILGQTRKGHDIDHINRNPLDNRKCNLRLVSHATNNRNHRTYSSNSSGANGVMFEPRKARNRWYAQILTKDGHITVYCSTREEAIKQRNELEIKYGWKTANPKPEKPELVYYDLMHCDRCIQETNHRNGVCQKCKPKKQRRRNGYKGRL